MKGAGSQHDLTLGTLTPAAGHSANKFQARNLGPASETKAFLLILFYK